MDPLCPPPPLLPHAIELDRASNLRDLGGWPTEDGRHVRRGLIYRAPALLGLSPADREVVARLGIRVAVDFRGEEERARNPVVLEQVRADPQPIEPSIGAGLRDIVLTGQASGHVSPADMLDLLTQAYRAYALHCQDRYRALFAHLARADSVPILFHCSAGKDRTGFGAALLLTALGVAWEHVLADYLATNRPPDVKDTLLSVHESLLVAAFDSARGAYGSIDAYLAQAVGLDGAARTSLMDRFLES
jgi:protein-tyrosine phosphatase